MEALEISQTRVLNKSKVSTRVELITPELAEEYLTHNISNRHLNQNVINDYVSQIIKGQWKMNGESIVFLENGILANGQHRLNAVIKANKPIETVVVRGADNDSMPTYDSGRLRSISDVFNLEKISYYAEKSSSVNKYLQIKIGGGFRNNAGFDRKKYNLSKKDILDEYLNNRNVFDIVYDNAKKINKNKILDTTLVVATIVFLHKDKQHDLQKINNFFQQLLDVNIACTNTTISTLKMKLIDDMKKINKLNYGYKFNLIKKTWNSYITNKNLKKLILTDDEDFI